MTGIVSAAGGQAYSLLKALPGASSRISSEIGRLEHDLEQSLKPKQHHEKILALPREGRNANEILRIMREWRAREEPRWRQGRVSGAVYHGGDELLKLLNEACSTFAVSNPLHADLWPSVMQFEAEIVAMAASLVNGGNASVCGSVTSGGTESIFLSVKTHREWGGKEKGIQRPEVRRAANQHHSRACARPLYSPCWPQVVAPRTAHAAFDKACELMRIKLIKVDVDPETFQVDPRAVERCISSNTILIVASAPQFPHGVIDPIEELSRVAAKHGVGLHVDCCLGGFILPFARRLGFDIPAFDFGLQGVTAMSMDTHKFGYAPKGTSVVLYRSRELRRYQYFKYASWPGGLYATPTLAGSRPGALSAGCWAAMVHLGQAGYERATRAILDTAQAIRRGVDAIPELRVLGDPKAMIVAFGSDTLNVYVVSDKMSKRGWSLNALQMPACVHICVTLRTVEYVDDFLRDLREVVEEVKANPGAADKDGNAPLYGMASSLPAGPVEDMLAVYCDVVYKV